jgi:5-methylcytosine-specific restriction endonuclease McrA
MPSGVYTRTKEHLEKIRIGKENSNYHISAETRIKISLSKSGDKNPSFGVKQSKETIEKRVSKFRGEKSHFWKGGLTTDYKTYQHNYYNALPIEKKEYIRWLKNSRQGKRKHLIKIGSYHTYEEWCLLKKEYNYTCPCCKISEPTVKLTEDHIVPLSKNGTNDISNIQPLCSSCNCKKRVKIIKYEK